jgi:hypothetical protein
MLNPAQAARLVAAVRSTLPIHPGG